LGVRSPAAHPLERFIGEHVAGLRARAALLGEYGATEAAVALQRAAGELEANFRSWWLAELPISEAAAEAGYSEERVREWVREGRLDGGRAGEPGPLRVRRCDLPRKPGQQLDPLVEVAARLGIE
jgi:hypothetical protein